MPDIRESTLRDRMDATRFLVLRSAAWRARVRLGVRRLVVRTSVPPLTHLYRAMYRLHLLYAVRVLRRLPGVHSIYVTGGLGAGEMIPGISDIDLAVHGNWTDDEQMRVASAMRRLSAMSPLFDPQLGSSTHTLGSLVDLYSTDYFFQHRFDVGRTQWKRVYGEDLFALLPPASQEKAAGGYYSEVRIWWAQFVYSAFGSGVTATDSLFRTSIAYKAVAAIQQMALAVREDAFHESALPGGKPSSSFDNVPLRDWRGTVLRHVLDRTQDKDERDFLLRLQRCRANRYLHFEGDVQGESFPYLIETMERLHRDLALAVTFQPVANSVRVDAAADELLLAPGTHDHVSAIIAEVKGHWAGYRKAYLVPSLSFFYPDDLLLMIDVDPQQLPTIAEIRELCRTHVPAGPLRQRIALFLLLPQGGYQLQIQSSTELWHHTVCPLANPELFCLLSRPGFLIDGIATRSDKPPVWTRFAQDQLTEEITVRRAAFGKDPSGAANLSSLDLLRNLWRQVQLEIVAKSAHSGEVIVPLTLAAMLRSLRSWGLPADSIFDRLADAYRSEMAGSAVDVNAMLPEVMQMLVMFS